MNIYHVQWNEGGIYGMNAVVTSSSDQEAIKLLDLSSDDTDIRANIIGVCTDASACEQIVCRESL